MATLKDHQQAMVDLLASGSGIPAPASRLAHAMHDVLNLLASGGYILEQSRTVIGEKGPVAIQIKNLLTEPANPTPALKELMNRRKETTPGLNDKALTADVEACRVKLTGAGGGPKADLFDRAVAAERRVKELENTVKQLRANITMLRGEKAELSEQLRFEKEWYAKSEENVTRLKAEIASMSLPEQAGCRKPDTQLPESDCDHSYAHINMQDRTLECGRCGCTVAWPVGFDPTKVRV